MIIYGTSGGDVITAPPGDSTILTGAGDDTVIDSYGTDIVDTGSGDDYFAFSRTHVRSTDADQVSLGTGNDTAYLPLVLISGNGTRTLNGGVGTDTLFIDGRNDTIGLATVDFRQLADAGTLFLGGVQLSSFERVHLVATSVFENVTFGDLDDYFEGRFGDFNTVYGNGGNDLIDSGAQGDFLYGGSGDDIIIADGGTRTNPHTAFGESGDDVIFGAFKAADYGSNSKLSGGGGKDGFVYVGRNAGNRSEADTIVDFNPVDDWVGFSPYSYGNHDPQVSRPLPINPYNIVDTSTQLRFSFDFVGVISIETSTFVYNKITGELGIGNSSSGRIFTFSGAPDLTVDDFFIMSRQTGTYLSNILHGDETDNFLFGEGGDDTIFGGDGDDFLLGHQDNDTLYGEAGNDTLSGGNDEDVLLGGPGDDLLEGDPGDDVLDGGIGSDYLNGGGGRDVMDGGAGDDRFRVQEADDVVAEAAGEGTDTVYSSVDYALGSGVHVERLNTNSGAGTADIDLIGNALSQTISGNRGDNFLSSGGAGDADVLRGLSGDDRYRVYNADDVVEEGEGRGTDTVYSSVDYALGSGVHVERLNTNSGAGTADIDLIGNALSQTISGNRGDNFLSSGGAGDADVLRGLSGDDRYRVYNADDVVEEGAGRGTDTVYSSVDYALGSGVHVERLNTHSSAGTADIDLIGNALSQTISGNRGDNFLSSGGTGGADVLRGLSGDDRYRVYNADDEVQEGAGRGNDTVYSSVDYALGSGVHVERLTTNSGAGTADIDLIGNALSQTISGNQGDNFLSSGGTGDADVLRGLSGDDRYRVYNADDEVQEGAGRGNDTVYSSVDYALGSGVHVERLNTHSGAGTSSIDLTGNELDQAVTGNRGANTLDGGLGADILRGLSGADTFQFSTALGGGNVDTIDDFSTADDQIALDDAVFSALPAGQLSAAEFRANAAGQAQDASDRIIYETDTGNLWYDADGTGATARVQFASLEFNLGLTAADFDVI